MSTKKTIIESAKAEFEAIKKYATEEAAKQMVAKIQPKLDEMLDKKLKKTVSEAVNIDADGASIQVSDGGVTVEKDGVTVSVDSEGSDMVGGEMDPTMGMPIDMPAPMIDMIGGEEEIESDPEMDGEAEVEEFEGDDKTEDEDIDDETEDIEDETEDEEEEPVEEAMFEVIKEEEELGAELGAELEPSLEEPAMEEPSAEVGNPFQAILDAINALGEKLEGGTADAGEAEGEVAVIDDTAEPIGEPGMEEPAMEAPAMEEPSLEEPELEGPVAEEFELDEFDETDFVDETEVVGETGGEDMPFDEEGMEEMHGVSHSVSTKGQSSKFGGANNPNSQSKRINVNENTSQHESRADEILKENKGLKKDIGEFEDAFIILRSQIDEMQSFNAKLAYANKIFVNGGLTTDEKLAINEEFNKASTVTEAKNVYQKIVKEHNISLKTSAVSKIKSKSINVGQISESSKPVYESEEAKILKEEIERGQMLAGIRKKR